MSMPKHEGEENIKEWGGGSFKGSVYFSEEKPQGMGGEQDTLKFDPESWNLLSQSRTSQRTPEIVAQARKFLTHIGYLDKVDPESRLDRRMQGAIKRYEYNFIRNTMGFKSIKETLRNLWNKEDNPLEQ